MDDPTPKLNDAQLTALNAVYAPFRETGRWPRYGYVDKILDRRGVDAHAVLPTLPPSLMRPDPCHIVVGTVSRRHTMRVFRKQSSSTQRSAAEGTRLLTEAQALHARGEWEKALPLLERALVISRELSDHRAEAKTLTGLGDIYRQLAQFTPAQRSLDEASKLARDVGARDAESEALNNIGLLYMDTGRREDAAKLFQEAITMAREIGDQAGEEVIRQNLNEVRGALLGKIHIVMRDET